MYILHNNILSGPKSSNHKVDEKPSQKKSSNHETQFFHQFTKKMFFALAHVGKLFIIIYRTRRHKKISFLASVK